MKKAICSPISLALCALAVLSLTANAQSRNIRTGSMMQNRNSRAGAGGAAAALSEGDVKIKAPARPTLSETPEFQFGRATVESPLSSQRRKWALYEVEYQTGDPWTDQLAFTYHIITKGGDDRSKDRVPFSYYTTTVRYIDIPKGKHRSCIVLPPAQLQRFGAPVAMAVEVAGKSGEVIASDSSTSGMNLPKEWWKDGKTLDNPQIARRNGLLDRSKTPFSLINADDYEVVQ